MIFNSIAYEIVINNIMKYYFIYRTTNLINDDYYIGKHETTNLDDGYLGSGKIIKLAIKKYGKENFVREIISFHGSTEEALNEERRIIAEHKDKLNCMNIVDGGCGFTSESGKRASQIAKEKGMLVGWFQHMTKDERTKISSMAAKINKENMTGLWGMTFEQRSNWSKESRKDVMWITDGVIERQVKKTIEIPEGWYKGRITTGSDYRVGMSCWTNGIINIFSNEKPDSTFKEGMTKITPTANMPWWNNGKINKRSFVQPDGFVPGRLKWESKLVTCPYCAKSGGETAMKRHHFEHCKKRSTND